MVVDVETAGFDAKRDALLEIGAVLLHVDDSGRWNRERTLARHVLPFPGANLDRAALEFNRIDPYHPFRFAVSEKEALDAIFTEVQRQVDQYACSRAILVGHNPAFDLAFIRAAANRCRIKRNPFHSFSTFDTASLAGLVYGQTVLSRSVQAAGLKWEEGEAHSAIYDAERTADLFCVIVNRWDELSGVYAQPSEVSGEAPPTAPVSST